MFLFLRSFEVRTQWNSINEESKIYSKFNGIVIWVTLRARRVNWKETEEKYHGNSKR